MILPRSQTSTRGSNIQPHDMKRLDSKRDKVLELMLDMREHTNVEITQVGGLGGMRRLWELKRAHGYDYEKIQTSIPGVNSYRLTRTPKDSLPVIAKQTTLFQRTGRKEWE